MLLFKVPKYSILHEKIPVFLKAQQGIQMSESRKILQKAKGLYSDLYASSDDPFIKNQYQTLIIATENLLKSTDEKSIKIAASYTDLSLLEKKLNQSLDIIEICLRQTLECERREQESVKSEQQLMTHISRTRVMIKKHYETLAELCPEQRYYYYKKSERLSRRHFDDEGIIHHLSAQEQSNYFNELAIDLQKKIQGIETAHRKEANRIEIQRTLIRELFILNHTTIPAKEPPTFTRSQVKKALSLINTKHMHAEALIFFLDCYLTIRKKEEGKKFCLFKTAITKKSLTEKMNDLLKYNKIMQMTYAELGVLIDSSKLKGSLLRDILMTFYSIPELAGLRQTVERSCLPYKRNLYRLDDEIDPFWEIQIDQNKVHMLPGQRINFSAYYSFLP